MSKVCKAAGCTVGVRRSQLMCRGHWFAVPAKLRARINETWRAWKATGLRDIAKACDYVEATDEAARYVAEGEGRLELLQPELPRWKALADLRKGL